MMPRFVLALILLAAPAYSDAPVLTRPEKEALRLVAKEWIGLGKWCVGKKLGTQAKQAAGKAAQADAASDGLAGLQKSAETCEDAATDADLKSYESQEKAARKKIAGILEKLYRMGEKETDLKVQERYEGYFWSAMEIDPQDKRWTAAVALASQAAADKKQQERAARIASRALSLGPPAGLVPALKKVLDAAATDGMILRTCNGHPLKYYLSLPRGFERKKGKKWPVLIPVDGAGSNFAGIAGGYRDARGSLSFIIASPCTFANTNDIDGKMLEKYQGYYTDEVIEKGKAERLSWDEQGILAMIEDLEKEYDAEERVYVTGFSGGGQATYMMTLRHPDLVNGSAPACGNFANYLRYQETKDKFTDADRNFPVHQITGEKDEHREFTFGNKASPGIEPQTDAAAVFLKDLGYPNVKRTLVPGMGHSSAIPQVIETFKPYWEGTKKRGDKL